MKAHLRNVTFVVIPAIAFSLAIFILSEGSPEIRYKPRKQTSFEPVSGIQGAVEQVYSRRFNPVTGTLELSDVLRSWKQADQLAAAQKKSSFDLYWTELGPDNVGGRTRALLIDRNNPNRMYAGGVSGGLWISDDAGDSWRIYADLLQNMAVASITQTSNGHIYFGTGEGMYGNWGNGAGGITGQGIWKSFDNGVNFYRLPYTWDSLTTVEKNTFANVNRLAADPVDPERIYAATKRGLRVTYDGGRTWYNPLRLNNNVFVTNVSSDVDVASNGVVIAAVGNRLYRSETGDTGSFVLTYNGLPNTGVGRYEFAISPSDPAYMYCSAAGTNGMLLNVYQSVDTGKTWTIIGDPSNPLLTNAFGSNGQGAYDNALVVAPDNPKKIFFGGVQLFSWTDSLGWKKAATTKSDSIPYYVHSDNHFFVFHPNDPKTLYIGNDGGIYKSTDQGATWDTSNNQYRVTQFYALGASRSGDVIGGTQDNGTQYITPNDTTPRRAQHIKGGDGAFCEISAIDTNAFFASSQLGSITRSPSKGSKGTFKSFYDKHIAPDPSLVGTSYSFSGFVTPYLLWEDFNGTAPADTSFFVGLVGSVWITKGALDFSSTPKWFRVAAINGTAQTMALSADGDALFVGTSGGVVYRITGLNNVENWMDTSGTGWDLTTHPSIVKKTVVNLAPQCITGIAVDQNNPNHAVITLGNYSYSKYVYRSANAMDSMPVFTSIQNNLPLMPVYGAVIDRYDSTRIILGTELGIYASIDGGATWTEQNFGMARVPVFQIRQLPLLTSSGLTHVLYIATHGRGIYRASTIDGIAEKENPRAIAGLKVYPNPARTQCAVEYELTETSDVRIELMDIRGSVVHAKYLRGERPGSHTYQLAGDALPSGSYLVCIRTEKGETKAARLLVVK